jgi:hypothetical protein
MRCHENPKSGGDLSLAFALKKAMSKENEGPVKTAVDFASYDGLRKRFA